MQLSQYNITKLKTKVKCKCGGQMIIEKLNSKGLKLRTSIEQSFLPGLKIFLEFVLDDAKHSIVKKEVVVKAKQGKYLSAEFTSSEHSDNLKPYLFFNKLYIYCLNFLHMGSVFGRALFTLKNRGQHQQSA